MTKLSETRRWEAIGTNLESLDDTAEVGAKIKTIYNMISGHKAISI